MNRLVCYCFSFILLAACVPSKDKGVRTDTPTSGVAELVSDECFARIVQEQVDVFESTYQEAFLLPQFMNEIESVDLLLRDSVRFAILARDLTQKEKDGIHARNEQLVARSRPIAVDGVALIINKQNNDSLISVPTLKRILTGELTSWKELNADSRLDKITVVFDNPNSSTVRFMIDSICGGAKLSTDLHAQSDNLSVIEYVSKTPQAMGVIGVNWISNPNDTTNVSFLSNIRVMGVSRAEPATADNAYQPLPAHLALRNYPLTRDIYMVLTDLRGTLLFGFYNFVAGDIGQRIILKSNLVPATRPVRIISIQEEN